MTPANPGSSSGQEPAPSHRQQGRIPAGVYPVRGSGGMIFVNLRQEDQGDYKMGRNQGSRIKAGKIFTFFLKTFEKLAFRHKKYKISKKGYKKNKRSLIP